MPRSGVPRSAKAVLLRVLLVAVTLLAIEVGLEIVFSNTGSDSLRRFASYRQLLRNDAPLLYSPHRYLGYVPTPGFEAPPNRHNAMGFRGDEIIVPKPQGTFRVVCVGGSTTYTVDVDDYRQSYPYLLGRVLRERGRDDVEVINAGVGGWSTWESMISLPLRLSELEPDLIVVYHGFNDVLARIVWPPEAYRPDNSGRRRPKSDRLGDSWADRLVDDSNLLRTLSVLAGWKAPAYSFKAFDDYPATSHLYDLDRQVSQGEYPSGLFEKVPLETVLAANPPTYFRQNLEALIELARAESIDVVLATMAYVSDRDDYVTSLPAFSSALDEHNAILRDLAARTGVGLFDFAEEFPSDRSLFSDGIHVNADGSRRKAELFARDLEPRLPPIGPRTAKRSDGR